MVLIRLEHHEHPAPPQHEMRQKTVLDSGDETVGTVANLYVDEDSRQLRFVDVITDDQHYIFLGLEKKAPSGPCGSRERRRLRLDHTRGGPRGCGERAALPGPACRARRGVPAHHPRTLRLRVAEDRTSEKTQKANFAELLFHALG
jgi:hypothetical protein